MALFKPFRGSRTTLDTQALHDGYAYFCTDDGSFHIDYVDDNGILQRKQVNAREAEMLSGMTLEQILASSQADWSVNNEADHAYVKNRTHYTANRELLASFEMSVDNVSYYSVDDAASSDIIRRFINDGNSTADVFIDGTLYQCQALFTDGNYYINLDGATTTYQGLRIYIGGSKPNMIYLHPDSFGLDMSAETRKVEVYTPEIVQQLDPKYIKDMYHEEYIEVFSVENATFNDHQYVLEVPFVIEDGSTYIVNWDSVEYTCEAYIFEGIPAIGNTAEFGGQGNGEPFNIGYVNFDNLTFVNSLNDLATHTLSVTEIVRHTIAPKYIKDMYYEEENRVNIAGMVFGSEDVDFPRGVEETHNFNIPFALGQVWNVNYGNGSCNNLEVKEAEDGTLYIGTYPDVNNTPFYITAKTYKGHSSWWDQMQPYSCVITGVSGTYTDSPIIHQIDTKYIPILEDVSETVFEIEDVVRDNEYFDPSYKMLLGEYTVIVDGVSETIEFIDDGDYSFAESNSFYIETWDGGSNGEETWDAGVYFNLPDDGPHSVKIVEARQLIKEEYLPDNVVATPDWNQNDHDGEGYIKNRPFYEETKYVTYIEEQTVTLVASGSRASGTIPDVNMPWDWVPYKVTFDGVEYEGTMTDNADNAWIPITLNSGEYLQVYNYGSVSVNSSSFAGDHTIKVEQKSTAITTIENKYLGIPVWQGEGDSAVCINSELNVASGDDSHAEGWRTTASGSGSHSEGSYTTASGNYSHAEGRDTEASGDYSHAEGYGTIAQQANMNVYGKFNLNEYSYDVNIDRETVRNAYDYGYKIEDFIFNSTLGRFELIGVADKKTVGRYVEVGKYYVNSYDTTDDGVNYAQIIKKSISIKSGTSAVIVTHEVIKTGSEYTGKYVHIVGNGISDTARSNAHTLDWNGVGWYQGGLQVGGNAQDDGAKNVLLEGDAIPVPVDATVGQTIVVKSVDENGKPTEWEAVDPMVITSSTEGSTKKFKITVDDTGTLTVTEMIEQ